jgi:hypothetical protein
MRFRLRTLMILLAGPQLQLLLGFIRGIIFVAAALTASGLPRATFIVTAIIAGGITAVPAWQLSD